jgi:hypothetical protein
MIFSLTTRPPGEATEKTMSERQATLHDRNMRDLAAQVVDLRARLATAEAERNAAVKVVDAVQAFLNKNGAQRATHWGLAEALAEFGQFEQASIRAAALDGKP